MWYVSLSTQKKWWCNQKMNTGLKAPKYKDQVCAQYLDSFPFWVRILSANWAWMKFKSGFWSMSFIIIWDLKYPALQPYRDVFFADLHIIRVLIWTSFIEPCGAKSKGEVLLVREECASLRALVWTPNVAKYKIKKWSKNHPDNKSYYLAQKIIPLTVSVT